MPVPPPALVARADPHPDVIQIAKELGVPVTQLVKAAEAHDRASADVRSFVEELNRTPAPSAGQFVGGAMLTYRTTRDVSLREVVREMLRLPDERLITESAVNRLIAANKADRELTGDLTRLRDSLGNPATVIPLGKAKEVVVDTADGLLFQAKQNRVIIAVLENLPEAALTPAGKLTRAAVLSDAGKLDIHRSVQGLSLAVERENSVIAFRANQGTLQVQTFLSDQLRELRRYGERAALELPLGERESVAKIVRVAERQAHNTVVDASVRAAEQAELRKDLSLALRHLTVAIRAASLLEDTALLGKNGRAAGLLVDTHEKARMVMAREIASELVSDKKPTVEQFRERIGESFSGAEVEVVIALSLIRAAQEDRVTKLSEGGSGADLKFSKRCFTEAADAYGRALAVLGGKEISKTTVPERALVYEASVFLLERAFTEKQKGEVSKLLGFHEQMIAEARRQGFENEAMRQERSLEVRLARAAFESPSENKEIAAKLGIGQHKDEAARRHYLDLVDRRVMELTEQRDAKEFASLPAEAQRALLQELTSAQVSLSRMYVFCVVTETYGRNERAIYYDRLAALNTSVLLGERKIIDQLRVDVARIAAENGAASPEYVVLSAELKARHIAAATLLVQQAEVALLGNVPDLTRKASAIIAELKVVSQDGSKEVAQLVKNFEAQYLKGGLQAAVKEFLSEVNRDYPPYVLTAMIAAGIIGGLGGYSLWRRQGAFCGFMLMSCLVLGGVKAGYGVNGIGQIQAAHETGLAPHTYTQDFLNVCYLLADIAQALPIFAAAAGIRKLNRLEGTKGKEEVALVVAAEEEKQRSTAGRLLSAVFTEVGGSLRTVGSILNPLNPMSGLMYITLGTAMTQLLTSNLPNAVLKDLVGKFGLEVGATLFIAFIYERIAANLDENYRGKKAPTVKDTVNALNSGGDSVAGAEPIVSPVIALQPAGLEGLAPPSMPTEK